MQRPRPAVGRLAAARRRCPRGGRPRAARLPSPAAGAAILAVAVVALGGRSSSPLLIGLHRRSRVATVSPSTSWSRAVEGARRATDRAASPTSSSSAFAARARAARLAALHRDLARASRASTSDFFTETERNVIGEGGGAYHAILGTLIITGVATLVSVPIGIMAAIYLQEYGQGRLRRALTFFVDVMTGIPSIVAGLFAFALFALFFGPGRAARHHGRGRAVVLMIPIVVRSTEEMLRIVPERPARGLLRAGRAEVADDHQGRAADGARAASSPASCSPSRASSARPRRC